MRLVSNRNDPMQENSVFLFCTVSRPVERLMTGWLSTRLTWWPGEYCSDNTKCFPLGWEDSEAEDGGHWGKVELVVDWVEVNPFVKLRWLLQCLIQVKKFCISLLEAAGSFAYTRGVMGELDTSISLVLHNFFTASYLAEYVAQVSFFQGRSGQTWWKPDTYWGSWPTQGLGGRLTSDHVLW